MIINNNDFTDARPRGSFHSDSMAGAPTNVPGAGFS